MRLLLSLLTLIGTVQAVCTIPSKPTTSTPTGCSVNSKVSDWSTYAWKYAPVIRFHPLESYYLADPETVFYEGQIYVPTQSSLVDASPANVYNMVNDPNLAIYSTVSYLTFGSNQQLLKGSSFDANGHSTAKIYYSSFTEDEYGTVVFNYNMYYAATGCSNQAIATNVSAGALSYVFCGVGLQESNWQSVRVRVCQSSLKVVQIAYTQHDWNEIIDCSSSSCNLVNGTHPEVYAALNSHASYGYASDNILYQKFASSSAILLDGVYLTDRTATDNNRSFVPSSANVVKLPSLGNISKGSSSIWAAFPSRWGTTLDNSVKSVSCFINNVTIVPCNETLLGSLLNDYLEVAFTENAGVWNIFDFVWKQAQSAASNVTGNVGPWTYAFNYQWTNMGTAPIYSFSSSPSCPVSLASDDSTLTADEDTSSTVESKSVAVSPASFGTRASSSNNSSSLQQLQNYEIKNYKQLVGFTAAAIFICVILLFSILSSVLCLCNSKRYVEYKEVPIEDTIEEEPVMVSVPVAPQGVIIRVAIFAFIALAVGVLGFALSSVGLGTLKNALQQLSQGNSWNSLVSLYSFFLAITLIVDVISLTSMFIVNSRVLFQRSAKSILNRCGPCWNAFSIVLIILVLFATMFTFAFGFIVFSTQYVVNRGCYNLSERLYAVCVDLNNIGFNLRYCGTKLVTLCSTWDSVNVGYLTIGPLLINMSQVSFLVLNVIIFVSFLHYQSVIKKKLSDMEEERKASKESQQELLEVSEKSGVQPEEEHKIELDNQIRTEA